MSFIDDVIGMLEAHGSVERFKAAEMVMDYRNDEGNLIIRDPAWCHTALWEMAERGMLKEDNGELSLAVTADECRRLYVEMIEDAERRRIQREHDQKERIRNATVSPGPWSWSEDEDDGYDCVIVHDVNKKAVCWLYGDERYENAKAICKWKS